MKTRTLAISILLLAVVLAPLAMAEEKPPQRGPRGGQGGPGQGRGGEFQGRGGFGGQPGGFRGTPGMGGDLLGRMAARLELTDEQKEQIKAIQEENKTQAKETQTALRKAHMTLQEATESGSDEDIIAAGKALGELYGKQGVLKAQSARKVKAILTPEQQAKMDEMKAQMKERMMQRREGQAPTRGQRGPGAENGGKGEGQGRGGRRRPPQEQE